MAAPRPTRRRAESAGGGGLRITITTATGATITTTITTVLRAVLRAIGTGHIGTGSTSSSILTKQEKAASGRGVGGCGAVTAH